MKEVYLKHSKERKENNLPPLVLDAKQTKSVVDNLISGSDDEFFLDLLTHRIPPGVDEAAYVKAGFLTSVAKGDQFCSCISQNQAAKVILGVVSPDCVVPLWPSPVSTHLLQPHAYLVARTTISCGCYVPSMRS